MQPFKFEIRKDEKTISFGPRFLGEMSKDILAVKMALGLVLNREQAVSEESPIQSPEYEVGIPIDNQKWFDCSTGLGMDIRQASTFDQRTANALMKFQVDNQFLILSYYFEKRGIKELFNYFSPTNYKGGLLVEDEYSQSVLAQIEFALKFFNEEVGNLGEATLALLHGWRPLSRITNKGYKHGTATAEEALTGPIARRAVTSIIPQVLYRDLLEGRLGQTIQDLESNSIILENSNFENNKDKLESYLALAPASRNWIRPNMSQSDSTVLAKNYGSLDYYAVTDPNSLLYAAVAGVLEDEEANADPDLMSYEDRRQLVKSLTYPDPFSDPDPFDISETEIGYFFRTDFELSATGPRPKEDEETIRDLENQALRQVLDFYEKPDIWNFAKNDYNFELAYFAGQRPPSPEHTGVYPSELTEEKKLNIPRFAELKSTIENLRKELKNRKSKLGAHTFGAFAPLAETGENELDDFYDWELSDSEKRALRKIREIEIKIRDSSFEYAQNPTTEEVQQNFWVISMPQASSTLDSSSQSWRIIEGFGNTRPLIKFNEYISPSMRPGENYRAFFTINKEKFDLIVGGEYLLEQESEETDTAEVTPSGEEVCPDQNTQQTQQTLEEYRIHAKQKRRQLVRKLREKIQEINEINETQNQARVDFGPFGPFDLKSAFSGLYELGLASSDYEYTTAVLNMAGEGINFILEDAGYARSDLEELNSFLEESDSIKKPPETAGSGLAAVAQATPQLGTLYINYGKTSGETGFASVPGLTERIKVAAKDLRKAGQIVESKGIQFEPGCKFDANNEASLLENFPTQLAELIESYLEGIGYDGDVYHTFTMFDTGRGLKGFKNGKQLDNYTFSGLNEKQTKGLNKWFKKHKSKYPALTRPRTLNYVYNIKQMVPSSMDENSGAPSATQLMSFFEDGRGACEDLGFDQKKSKAIAYIGKYTSGLKAKPDSDTKRSKVVKSWTDEFIVDPAKAWVKISGDNLKDSVDPKDKLNEKQVLEAFGKICTLDDLYDEFFDKVNLPGLICDFIKCLKLPGFSLKMPSFKLPPFPKMPILGWYIALVELIKKQWKSILTRILCSMVRTIIDKLAFPFCEEQMTEFIAAGSSATPVMNQALAQAFIDTGVPAEKKEDSKAFFDDASSVLTCEELSYLLSGKPLSPSTMRILERMVEKNNLSDSLTGTDEITNYFEVLGNFLPEEICEALAQPGFDDNISCEETATLADSIRNRLTTGEGDVSEEEIEYLTNLAKKNAEDQLNRLKAFSGSQLADQLPNPADAMTNLPEIAQQHVQQIIEGIFSAAKSEHVTTLGSYVQTMKFTGPDSPFPGDDRYLWSEVLTLEAATEQLSNFASYLDSTRNIRLAGNRYRDTDPQEVQDMLAAVNERAANLGDIYAALEQEHYDAVTLMGSHIDRISDLINFIFRDRMPIQAGQLDLSNASDKWSGIQMWTLHRDIGSGTGGHGGAWQNRPREARYWRRSGANESRRSYEEAAQKHLNEGGVYDLINDYIAVDTQGYESLNTPDPGGVFNQQDRLRRDQQTQANNTALLWRSGFVQMLGRFLDSFLPGRPFEPDTEREVLIRTTGIQLVLDRFTNEDYNLARRQIDFVRTVGRNSLRSNVEDPEVVNPFSPDPNSPFAQEYNIISSRRGFLRERMASNNVEHRIEELAMILIELANEAEALIDKMRNVRPGLELMKENRLEYVELLPDLTSLTEAARDEPITQHHVLELFTLFSVQLVNGIPVHRRNIKPANSLNHMQDRWVFQNDAVRGETRSASSKTTPGQNGFNENGIDYVDYRAQISSIEGQDTEYVLARRETTVQLYSEKIFHYPLSSFERSEEEMNTPILETANWTLPPATLFLDNPFENANVLKSSNYYGEVEYRHLATRSGVIEQKTNLEPDSPELLQIMSDRMNFLAQTITDILQRRRTLTSEKHLPLLRRALLKSEELKFEIEEDMEGEEYQGQEERIDFANNTLSLDFSQSIYSPKINMIEKHYEGPHHTSRVDRYDVEIQYDHFLGLTSQTEAKKTFKFCEIIPEWATRGLVGMNYPKREAYSNLFLGNNSNLLSPAQSDLAPDKADVYNKLYELTSESMMEDILYSMYYSDMFDPRYATELDARVGGKPFITKDECLVNRYSLSHASILSFEKTILADAASEVLAELGDPNNSPFNISYDEIGPLEKATVNIAIKGFIRACLMDLLLKGGIAYAVWDIEPIVSSDLFIEYTKEHVLLELQKSSQIENLWQSAVTRITGIENEITAVEKIVKEELLKLPDFSKQVFNPNEPEKDFYNWYTTEFIPSMDVSGAYNENWKLWELDFRLHASKNIFFGKSTFIIEHYVKVSGEIVARISEDLSLLGQHAQVQRDLDGSISAVQYLPTATFDSLMFNLHRNYFKEGAHEIIENSTLFHGARLVQVVLDQVSEGALNSSNNRNEIVKTIHRQHRSARDQGHLDDQRSHMMVVRNARTNNVFSFGNTQELIRQETDPFSVEANRSDVTVAACIPMATKERRIDLENCPGFFTAMPGLQFKKDHMTYELLETREAKFLLESVFPARRYMTISSIFATSILSGYGQLPRLFNGVKAMLAMAARYASTPFHLRRNLPAMSSEDFAKTMKEKFPSDPEAEPCFGFPEGLEEIWEKFWKELGELILQLPSILFRGVANQLDPAYKEMRTHFLNCDVNDLTWYGIGWQSVDKSLINGLRLPRGGRHKQRRGHYVPIMPGAIFDLVKSFEYWKKIPRRLLKTVLKTASYIYSGNLPMIDLDSAFAVPCFDIDEKYTKGGKYDVGHYGRYGHPLSPFTVLALSTPHLTSDLDIRDATCEETPEEECEDVDDNTS